MKRIITVLAGVILSATSFAQFSFGVQAIGNLSTAAINDLSNVSESKKMRALPGAGVVASYTVNPNLEIRSGINYLQHGFKLTIDAQLEWEGQVVDARLEAINKLNYIQVPLNILYTTAGTGVQFFAGGGPYFNYAISGKGKLTTTYKVPGEDPVTEKSEADPFEKQEDGKRGFKRADFGVGIIAGAKLGGNYFVNAGYQLSLSNIDNDEGGKYKNRGLQLTIGKMF